MTQVITTQPTTKLEYPTEASLGPALKNVLVEKNDIEPNIDQIQVNAEDGLLNDERLEEDKKKKKEDTCIGDCCLCIDDEDPWCIVDCFICCYKTFLLNCYECCVHSCEPGNTDCCTGDSGACCDGCDCSGCDCSGCDCSGCDCSGCDCDW